MKAILKFFLLLYIFNIIYSESFWNISFYEEEDIHYAYPNLFNITKGNFKTIQMIITNIEKEKGNYTHIKTKIRLNHQELKMIPNEIEIDTENSLKYFFDIGIPCNTESDSIEFDFEFEDELKDLVEINKCKAKLQLIPKIIDFSVLNKDGMTNNFFSKIYVKQDFKNFEKLDIGFTYDIVCSVLNYIEEIKEININEYNEDLLIYYSDIKPNIEKLKEIKREQFSCNISAINKNIGNNKCFLFDGKKEIQVNYNNKSIEIGNKESFWHNSIVSSFIDEETENSLSLLFYKEIFYFVSFCAIQDFDSNLLSDYEVLNQRLNITNKNIRSSFNISDFDNSISQPKIVFHNLDRDKNYKIKCIFHFFDNKENITLTYGKGMEIPISINFNETKKIKGKNCYNSEYMSNKIIDTRYCDIINNRLVFKIFYDMDYKFKLNNFNYTDYANYSSKNEEEKIAHIKKIINNDTIILSSQNELLSTLSDYLFIINCQENKTCQEEKNSLFIKILNIYSEKIEDINKEQLVLNDILLFNNIIENTDSINYENFEYLVNKVFNKKDSFFSSSTKKYNHYLANFFLLIFDKFISIITKFKSIYTFEIDKKLNIYKNDSLIKFYNYFITWISHGMLNREDRLLQFCHNLVVNSIETSVNSDEKTIINTETIKITGFDTEQSKILYKNLFSAGAISYKKFPLFALNNKKSEAVSFFLFTDLRENFENPNIAYSEAFKIIFKKKEINNYCYLWNNDYSILTNKELVNNFVSTEYLNKDNNKYDINCVSRIMISPMTIILGQADLKGSLFKEGISFLSIIVIIMITLCLIVISSPFLLSKFYKKQTQDAQNSLNELN